MADEKKKSKKKTGRPTKYKEEYNQQAFEICARFGATKVELAKVFNVNPDSVYEWCKKYENFSEAIQRGNDIFDSGEIEQALKKLALGFECKEIKFATYEGQITDSQEYIKHYPPHYQSIALWLSNRNPERWKLKDVETGNSRSLPVLKQTVIPIVDDE